MKTNVKTLFIVFKKLNYSEWMEELGSSRFIKLPLPKVILPYKVISYLLPYKVIFTSKKTFFISSE